MVQWGEVLEPKMHHHKKFDVHALTNNGMRSALLWAFFLSIFFVVAASLLGRAAKNMRAALVEKPDIAIYVLLRDEEIGKTTLLRESEDGVRRDYLAETPSGPLLVELRKGEEQWYVARTERLRK